MMSNKPRYNATAKSKSTGKRLQIAAFWVGEHGNTGVLGSEVEKIVLKNGAEITADNAYFDLYVNDPEETPAKPEPAKTPLGADIPDDASIPF